MTRVLIGVFAAGLVSAAAVAQPCIDVEQRREPVYMKGFAQRDCAQSFKPVKTRLEGAGLKTRPGIGVSGAVTIQLWKGGLPNAGGTMIATGTDPQVLAGEWAEVKWTNGCVDVTPGVTYYLVFLNDNNTLGIQGDTANPYPDGQVYANPGFQPFPNFDYTFYTACCISRTTCKYTIRKSKSKGGCNACPPVGGPIDSGIPCNNVQDCKKKFRTKIPCPNGQPGSCKIVAKGAACT
ncbi:MAG: hypothetical protein C4547_07210 [Phycisphaerales bacterium]|nr:MAG: hypothetical protein C4547_07210 [Phycisphaerales bacterium]